MHEIIQKQVILKAKNISKSQYGFNIKEVKTKKADREKDFDTNRRSQK